MGAVRRQGSILIGHAQGTLRTRLHHARCGAQESAHFYKTISRARKICE
jgi:hypothetical protein